MCVRVCMHAHECVYLCVYSGWMWYIVLKCMPNAFQKTDVFDRMDLFGSQTASPPLLSMVIHVLSVPWYVKSVIIIVSLSGQLNLCV